MANFNYNITLTHIDIHNHKIINDGIYYVFEPSNAAANSIIHEQKVRGFNDLQRRLGDLCHLVNLNCQPKNGSLIMAAVKEMNFVPLPIGGE